MMIALVNKNIRIMALLIFTGLFAAGCAGKSTNKEAVEPTDSSISRPYFVSMVELLVHPDRHVGSDIIVVGYLNTEIIPSLYLSEDAAVNDDSSSSILVNDESKNGALHLSDCNDHYIRITGRFYQAKDWSYNIRPDFPILFSDSLKVCLDRDSK